MSMGKRTNQVCLFFQRRHAEYLYAQIQKWPHKKTVPLLAIELELEVALGKPKCPICERKGPQ